MSSFVAVGAPRRFVSILISSALAYTDSEMELTRTCRFEFNRMLRADSKRVLLSTFCFNFMVACFTSLLPHPEVDKDGGPTAGEWWLSRPATAKKGGLSLYYIVG